MGRVRYEGLKWEEEENGEIGGKVSSRMGERD